MVRGQYVEQHPGRDLLVAWQVNLMKRDLTRNEFLALVKKIYHNSMSS